MIKSSSVQRFKGCSGNLRLDQDYISFIGIFVVKEIDWRLIRFLSFSTARFSICICLIFQHQYDRPKNPSLNHLDPTKSTDTNDGVKNLSATSSERTDSSLDGTLKARSTTKYDNITELESFSSYGNEMGATRKFLVGKYL